MIPEYRFAQIISRIIMLDFEKLKLRFTGIHILIQPSVFALSLCIDFNPFRIFANATELLQVHEKHAFFGK